MGSAFQGRAVVDAGVVVTALTDPGMAGDVAANLLAEQFDAIAPQLLDLEVLSVLRRAERADVPVPSNIVELLQQLPVTRLGHEVLQRRIWELRHNVTPYDAAYVALAELSDAPLITTDIRLARAPGLRCPVLRLHAETDGAVAVN
jgi:predicted nucleic acid-binding protein